MGTQSNKGEATEGQITFFGAGLGISMGTVETVTNKRNGSIKDLLLDDELKEKHRSKGISEYSKGYTPKKKENTRPY